MARRARRERHAALVAAQHQRLADDARNAQRQDVRQAARRVSEPFCVGDRVDHGAFDEFAQRFGVRRSRRLAQQRVFGGDHHADGARDVFGAAAHPVLLAARAHDRCDARLARQREKARALRAVELVRRDRDRVDVHRIEVERDLAVGLHEVDVHVRFWRSAAHEGHEFFELRQRAEFVVAVHQRDHAHVGAERIEQRLGMQVAVARDGQRHRVAAQPRQQFGRLQDRRVVALRHEHAARRTRHRGADDAEVVRFAPARREHDLGGVERSAQELARVVQPLLGACAVRVLAARVAKQLALGFVHGADDSVRWAGRGGVVEVDLARHPRIMARRFPASHIAKHALLDVAVGRS